MKILASKPIQNLKQKNMTNVIMAGSIMHQILNQGPDSLGAKVQRMPYDNDDLITSLSNSLKLRVHEIKQGQTIFGKLAVLFSKPLDTDWIQIDGTRLMQILELTETKHDTPLAASRMYYVEIVELQNLLQKAGKTKD